MKTSRKRSRSMDDAMKIVEAGIEKIVSDIRAEAGSDSKPSRPRGSKAKSHARRVAA